MLLSAADLASRLTHPKNSAKNSKRNLVKVRQGERTINDLDRNDIPAGPALHIRESGSGPRPGDTRIPDDVKIPAMVLARLGLGQDEIASEFGISQSAVSNLANGKAGSSEVKSAAESAIDKIRETVINKLDNSLNFLTDDKLTNAKATEVVSVARGLAGILESTDSKKKEGNTNNGVQIVIHGVDRVESNKYEVIEVGH